MKTKDSKPQCIAAPHPAFSSEFYKSEAEMIDYFREHPSAMYVYQRMHKIWQQRLMGIFNGTRTMPLTYDAFFKKIFHPDVHPERLSRLLSSLLGQEVEVLQILPNEDGVLAEDSLLAMDILVRLADGSLANVEVQRVPYRFPAERMSCYSSDLVMRQYSRVKGEKGKDFVYSDLKKVYTIVIYEVTSANLRTPEHAYIHYGKTEFDTNLKLDMIQEYCLVALDEYRKNLYDNGRIQSEQDAWIALLATDNMEDAEKLMEIYPWLTEIYQELAEMLCNPEEVLTMFSEALRILDSNTVQFMIEEQQEQLGEQEEQLEKQEKQLKEQYQQMEKQQEEIKEQKKRNFQLTETLKKKDQTIEEREQEIAKLKSLLASKS